MKIKLFLLKNLTLAVLLVSFIIGPLVMPMMVVGADKYGLDDTADAAGLSTTQKDLPTVIGLFIKYLLQLIGVILLLFLLYGGILWMTSAGSEDKIKKAKGIITNAIIGLVIILAAYSITWFVMDKLAGPEGAVLGGK
ncbi:pilin [Patescibacteria group bacterium]|nr:pilin [Patescibacteria group bacterium]